MNKAVLAFMAFMAVSCQSDEELSQEELPQEPTNGSVATTGTAERSGNIDVKWIQLWENGPKFAEYNVGAASATETGTGMSFMEAYRTGAFYVWGINWCTPSKADMEPLLNAAQGKTDGNVICKYEQVGNVWGFTFRGVGAYSGNSLFFPAEGGKSGSGSASYWAGPDSNRLALLLYLNYVECKWDSQCHMYNQNNQYHKCIPALVRPVLAEN